MKPSLSRSSPSTNASTARTGLSSATYSSRRAGNNVTCLRSTPCTKPAIDSPPRITRDGRSRHPRFHTAWAMSCREQLQHKRPQGWPWRPNITASCVKLEVRRGHFSVLVRPCNFGGLGNSRQDCEERDEDSFRRYNAPGFDNLFWTFAAGSCRGHQGLEYRQHVLDPRRARQGIRACEPRQARHRVWLDDTH